MALLLLIDWPSSASAQTAVPAQFAGHKEGERQAQPTADAKKLDQERVFQALRGWVQESQKALKEVRDYRCVLKKREEIGGELGEMQSFQVKIRQSPFSVYLRSIEPADAKDQEVIYVDGKSDNNMLVHLPPHTLKYTLLGTLKLDPLGVVMQTNRHPITHTGIGYLVEQTDYRTSKGLVSRDDVQIRRFPNARINDRPCVAFELRYLKIRENYDCSFCRIFFDRELKMPVRYEAYNAAVGSVANAKLLEMVDYSDIQLNVAFTDLDFSVENAKYFFP